jgi:hypothetical protein
MDRMELLILGLPKSRTVSTPYTEPDDKTNTFLFIAFAATKPKIFTEDKARYRLRRFCQMRQIQTHTPSPF